VKPVIFTDLDGTLLHPMDYSFEAALPALGLIEKRAIPLVLASSKTRAEIEAYRKRLSNHDPFISENGGAVFIPEKYFPSLTEGEKTDGYTEITLGTSYLKVRNALEEIREVTGAKIRGFGDMTVKEVADLSGLIPDEAELSKKRDFDEPFVIDGDENVKQQVLGWIKKKGFYWTRGRFFHIMGPHDKATAIKILKELFGSLYGKIETIGIGDSLNDVPLLEEADHPVLVRKEDGSYEPVSLPGLLRADGVGPEGWNSAVLKILEGLER
jgi:mannosyl-3-phosphoglycerate phosphatase